MLRPIVSVMSIARDAMSYFIELCFFLIACGLVSRAIEWMPQRYACEEAAYIKDVLTHHAPQVQYVVHHDPAFFSRPVRSFFSALPPANLQSGLAGLCVGAAAAGVWFSGLPLAATYLWFIFCCGLIVLAFVDYKTKLLPDILTLPLLWLGLVIQLFPETRTVGLELAVIGAVAGYLPLWLLAQIYRAVRGRDGLGMGDLKLLAAMGAWSGPFLLPHVLVLAVLLALAVYVFDRVMRRDTYGFHEERPFGPAIIAAYFVVLMYF